MKRRWKVFGYFLLFLAFSFGLIWWAIGPTWRTFLSDPPTKTDVLFWTQDQRDTGFALADKLPIINTVKINAGTHVRELPEGPTLKLDLDIDAYMQSQNSAAILVLHKGEIRLERYGLNQTMDGRWTSFSVAKSITSTLVGAAIKDGHIRSLEDKVSDYISALRGSVYDDVTIYQLMTMTSGVKWNEDYGDPTSDVAMFRSAQSVEGEASIVSYLKHLPRAHEAGQVFNYSTGETNLIGILVAEATSIPIAEYLSDKIWKPFGMQQDATWVLSETGEEISGCCIQASARDFARFGQFILEGGKANKVKILPEDWISKATAVQVLVPRDTDRDYGFQWWTLGDSTFSAIGIFGQGIFVDPARELVIATNSSWRDANGSESEQNPERYEFYGRVQRAIDREQDGRR